MKTIHTDANKAAGSICIFCGQQYQIDSIRFEQKLVEDRDFCCRCWDLIMSPSDDEDEKEKMVLMTSG